MERTSKDISRRQLIVGGAASLVVVGPVVAAWGNGIVRAGTTPTTEAGTATTEGGTVPPSGSAGTLAFGHPHATGAFYAVVQAGAEDQATALGYELLQSRAAGELERQIAEVQTWIAQGVTAMTILALDVNAMAPLLEEAKNAGIPFVCYAQSIEGADGYVLFDDEQAATDVGAAAADWINTNLGGSAKVAMMGDYTIQNVQIRLNGARDSLLANAPDAEIVFEGEGLLAPEALAATQTLLQQHPDLKVVICGADDGALGASQAFTTGDVDVTDVWIAGYDGSQPALEKAITGTDPLRMVAALNLYEIGQMVVTVPDNVIKGSGETDYRSPYTLVSVENAEVGQQLIDRFNEYAG